MKSVSIREAKAQLSALVTEAAKGKAFVITKAGKAVVKVVPFEAISHKQTTRLGFMAGRLKVPKDFDRMSD